MRPEALRRCPHNESGHVLGAYGGRQTRSEFEKSERPLVVRFLLELAVAAVVVPHLTPFTASAMESKKRPHADDGEHSRAKKRAVSDDRASPSHPNGTTSSHGDEPKDGDDIEVPCLQYGVVRAQLT